MPAERETIEAAVAQVAAYEMASPAPEVAPLLVAIEEDLDSGAATRAGFGSIEAKALA